MFKLVLLLINLAGQPVAAAPYPIHTGTPDAEYASQAACEAATKDAVVETQAMLDKETQGQIAVADAKCLSKAEVDEMEGKKDNSI